MLRSMTGFGRASTEADGRTIVVELKSVNHRYLDIAMRLPRYLAFLETEIRAVLSQELDRGHVDVYLNYRNDRTDARQVEVDLPLLTAYREAFALVAQNLGIPNDASLPDYARIPDIMNVVEADDDREAVTALAAEATRLAAREMIVMREAEGTILAEDLRAKTDTLRALIASIDEKSAGGPAAYRDKLRARIDELLGTDMKVDEGRLESEVAFFADRINVDEEIVRFRSHLDQLLALFDSTEPAGRRFDFLVQELNREANTIGSKSADADITRIVIECKAEIEKIREQVQNIE